MIKYTIEQFREYCKDKDHTQKIACPICSKLYSYKGLWTHVDRSHNESKQYCQGNNGCYNKPEYKKALKNGLNKYHNETLGEFKEFEVECYKCHKKFKVKERENKFPSKDKYFCSKFCSHSHDISNETKYKLSIQAKKHRKYPQHNICKCCGKETENRIIKDNLIPYKCACCGQEPIWQGKELVLVLDHINGINNDNRLSNLRFLCPNCNAQQDTFCGKGIKRKVTDEEKEKLKQLNNLRIEEKINRIKNYNIDFSKLGWVEKVAKLENTSHTQIRRFMKKYMNDFYKKCYIRKNQFK